MVARLSSAMGMVLERGTGQARIQRSQPIHISISNCTSPVLNGCTSLRCVIPINGSCEFFAVCVVILVLFYSNTLQLAQKRAMWALAVPECEQMITFGCWTVLFGLGYVPWRERVCMVPDRAVASPVPAGCVVGWGVGPASGVVAFLLVGVTPACRVVVSLP